VRIRDGVGRIDRGRFGECITKKVGDGSATFFLSDPRLGGVPMCEWFEWLFDLAENKSSMVPKMFVYGWEAGGGAWVWRRQLWEDEMLGKCQTLLLPFTVQAKSPDMWLWQFDHG
jgi:hypothetical protein